MMARNKKFDDEYQDDWTNDFRDGKRKNRYSDHQQNRKEMRGRRDRQFNSLMERDEDDS